jgi:hypothetical protein
LELFGFPAWQGTLLARSSIFGLDFLGFPWILSSETSLFNGLLRLATADYLLLTFPRAGQNSLSVFVLLHRRGISTMKPCFRALGKRRRL